MLVRLEDPLRFSSGVGIKQNCLPCSWSILAVHSPVTRAHGNPSPRDLRFSGVILALGESSEIERLFRCFSRGVPSACGSHAGVRGGVRRGRSRRGRR